MLYRTTFTQLLFICIATYTQTVTAAGDFHRGLQYFESQQYNKAISSFQTALRSGDGRAIVYYNLAVSEYKTGDLTNAESHFRTAARDEQFYDLSQYNLGLIHTRQHDYKLAKQAFRRVRKATNPALYKRASRMIARIDNEPQQVKSILDDIHGLVSVTAGRDDNVNRAVDNSPSNISDSFTSAYLSTSIPVTEDRSFGVNASYYTINYSDLNTDDFDILRAGLFYKTRFAAWRTRTTVSYAKSDLGHNGFQDITRLEFSTKRKLADASKIRIVYQYDDIASSDIAFNYLDGWRQRLRLSYKQRFGDLNAQFRYRLELNDRRNTLTRSFSPTRHTIRGIANYSLSDDWSLRGNLAYRDSNYPDVGTNPDRNENRTRAAIKLRFSPDKRWFVEISYRHTENDSDNAQFDYNRDDVHLSMAYTY